LVVYLASDQAKDINGCVFSLRHEGTIELHEEPPAVKSIYSKTPWILDDLIIAVPNLMTR
jgi:hypothetical protein